MGAPRGNLGTANLAPNAATKLYAANATTSGPTKADNTYATIPELSITADFGGNPILVFFQGEFKHNTANGSGDFQLRDGGAAFNDRLRRGRLDGPYRREHRDR